MDNEIMNQDNNKILIYTSDDGQVKIEVRLEDENVWLTQNAMAELFDTTKQNISLHIRNIFEENELNENSVVKENLTTASDGKNYKTKFYNLDLIISVGYRVKSIRGTQFRIWANKLIKEYLIKGYNLNVDRFKNNGGGVYFEEVLEKIRDIRSSEKVFWRKILDIYATSVDYDAKDEKTKKFFKTVQNKMHYAVHGNTAAEVIFNRVDSEKENIGLTNFKGNIPTKSETEIAKNYLSEKELDMLNRMVSAYLDVAEYPFNLSMDEKMKQLLESIVINGIITPLIVRKRHEGYEIISGHRRKYIAEILNIKKLPCIVKEMNDIEAILAMVDSNIYRENILPSEKAFAYKMKLEAMKNFDKKLIILNVNSESWNLNCAEFIDEINNQNNMTINKYIKLTNLIPELLELVDNKRIALRPAIELLYLSKENQVIIRNIFDMNEVTPSLSQAIQLKRLEQEGKLNEDVIEEILSKEKPNQKERFSIPYEDLKKYLQKNYSDKQIKNIIVEALNKYSKK